MLRHRAPDKTICPSGAARVAGGAQWRTAMAASREVAFGLADDGVLEVRQGGKPVDGRTAKGALRLGRGAKFG